ncbi:hypothetical protein B0T24DRAFT_612137 [Lasiosphaeria ovina]|uniref:Uncharacterized protein n=1 Tax=Lasiosphaeria ovina TaxID=92902 RepID=A0AAE0KMQ8_9PEZI|nr:hypothetical protein B0T24DRAFT_612137 [Lasiosphaeria ovina]
MVKEQLLFLALHVISLPPHLFDTLSPCVRFSPDVFFQWSKFRSRRLESILGAASRYIHTLWRNVTRRTTTGRATTTKAQLTLSSSD